MGCGSSKAVVAPNNAVTIKKSDAGSSSVKAQSPPTSPQSHKADDNTEEEERSSSADLARNQSGLSSKPVLGPIPRGASDGESSSALGVNSPIVEGSTGEEGIRKPVSFEVAFSSNGEPVTKKPPRRLQVRRFCILHLIVGSVFFMCMYYFLMRRSWSQLLH